MSVFKIKNGLDIPIGGRATVTVATGNPPKSVALLGPDYAGMKPTFLVAEGDTVKLGQVLFIDKKRPAIKFTSPGAGKILSIHRGAKRAFLSIIIQLQGKDRESFTAHPAEKIAALTPEQIKKQLLESGLWTALLERPFGKVADPDAVPSSIFVTAMDSNPLAPPVDVIVQQKAGDFRTGLEILAGLTGGKIYVCKKTGTEIPVPNLAGLSVNAFSGPHPAGLPGTHIHFLDPVSRNKKVWSIGAQDVAAIGHLFSTGELDVERTIALAGPGVKNPRLIKTRIGACVSDIVENELRPGEQRCIAGSVLSGNQAKDEVDYLGRYHQQISVVPESRKRVLFGWLDPGAGFYSMKNIVLSKLLGMKKLSFSTAVHGGRRAIVPSGNYEAVMPLDILPTYLLRALAVDDVEEAEALGCLELVEEDLALCTFGCPSKIDHGTNLRRNLTIIEKEG